MPVVLTIFALHENGTRVIKKFQKWRSVNDVQLTYFLFAGWAAEELFHYFVAYKMKWQDRGFDTPILNKTLFRKIRYFLGGRVRLLLSGGAPLSPDTHSLVRTCLCVPLMQVTLKKVFL